METPSQAHQRPPVRTKVWEDHLARCPFPAAPASFPTTRTSRPTLSISKSQMLLRLAIWVPEELEIKTADHAIRMPNP